MADSCAKTPWPCSASHVNVKVVVVDIEVEQHSIALGCCVGVELHAPWSHWRGMPCDLPSQDLTQAPLPEDSHYAVHLQQLNVLPDNGHDHIPYPGGFVHTYSIYHLIQGILHLS